jgi:hypothetical protein
MVVRKYRFRWENNSLHLLIPGRRWFNTTRQKNIFPRSRWEEKEGSSARDKMRGHC